MLSSSERLNEDNVSTNLIPHVLNKLSAKRKQITGVATINGALYFFIAAAGAGNIKKLFHIADESTAVKTMYGVGTGASLCYGMVVYKVLENLELRPKSYLNGLMLFLTLFSSSAFFAAGIEGSRLLGIADGGAATIGFILFILRIITLSDAAVKCPNRLKEMKSAWATALETKDYKELTILILTGYTAFGYSMSLTDAIFSTINKFGTFLGATETSTGLQVCAYIGSSLGAIGMLPMPLYWTHRGIKQIINRSKEDSTDKYTYLGLIATTPTILGVLGGVTVAEGKAFGKLGMFSTVIRASSAIVYAACSGTPGLSTLFRGISGKLSSCTSTIFNSSCCRRKVITKRSHDNKNYEKIKLNLSNGS